MLHFPALRWGEPYESLDKTEVVHFATGEPVASISRVNPGIVARDLRRAERAREALRELSPAELIDCMKRAAELFMNAELPVGEESQGPEDFVRLQSATTGLPESLCRMNMGKLEHVLTRMDAVLASLTRELDLELLVRGWGEENGIMRSYQAQSPVLGMVLPSNSPGVHTLWMPVLPLQVGLVMKPGSREPWTPWRMARALIEAGVPRRAIGLYPGDHAVGGAILKGCDRSLIFGGPQTVERYRGDPRVQVHGPGYSKILLGEDVVDDWEEHLDLMVDSVLLNSGRSCINASGVWAPRHAEAIADALARRLTEVEVRAHDDPDAELAAFTDKGTGLAISEDIDAGLDTPGAEDVTGRHRDGSRLVERERCDYVLPTVIRCDSPEHPLAAKEYMFPYVAVVECPQKKMLREIGPTLVLTAITEDESFRRRLLDCTDVDRLNLGPIPTTSLDWLQPHEGNIVEFLFRARALQRA